MGHRGARLARGRGGPDCCLESDDGVVLIDPVSVSYLLAATGPLDLGDGETLTADTAVALLLHDVYVRLPVDRQDAFFADAARRIFDAVASGEADSALLARALGGKV